MGGSHVVCPALPLNFLLIGSGFSKHISHSIVSDKAILPLLPGLRNHRESLPMFLDGGSYACALRFKGGRHRFPALNGGVSMSIWRKSILDMTYISVAIFRKDHLLYFGFSNICWTADLWMLFHCLIRKITHSFQSLSLASRTKQPEMIKKIKKTLILYTIPNIISHDFAH